MYTISLTRVDLFNHDFEDLFARCNCDSFKQDYYRSILYYFIATCIAGFTAIVNLASTIVMRCRRRPGVMPLTQQG